ncbi:MAG TPA: thioredoxin-like domain-containing protein [Bacteroidales bacterium]|nr:thioredoxin-like domain-containing protein [Bacteroidales bacterium]
MKKYSLFLSLFLISLPLFSQVSGKYEISVSVSGLRDSSIYLAYHFGDKQYITDTTLLDKNGKGLFSGNELLPQGIYMIVLPGRKYFEVLVSRDQVFSVSCSYNDYFNTLIFSGSVENNNFLAYQKKWSSLQQQSVSLSRRIQTNKGNRDSLRVLSEKQGLLEDSMKAYLLQVYSQNKDNLLGVLVRSMMPIELPDFHIPLAARNPDSLRWVARYNYNKDHFFDNIDLTDERLLRTPILQGRLQAFFSNVVIQSADSINKEIDKIMTKCESNPKVYQFVAVFLFNHFRQSEIMGHDAVIVKLADDIYLSGKADWVTNEFRDDLKRQVDMLRNNLIGMKAQNMVMDSFNGIFVSLHDIEKEFTILYFWEPNCGFCKEYTPKLRDYYEKVRNDDIEVFSVCTTNNKSEWTKYIQQNNLTSWINGWDPDRRTHFDFYYNVQATPLIYILDKDKKIIAKKISVDDVPSFIDSYKMNQR